MSTLESSIASLAENFARAVASAIRGASLHELTGFAGGSSSRPGRKPRRGSHPGWPKCPTCGKNAWPRGKGYCFEHAKAGGKRKAARGAKRRASSKKPAAKAKG